MPKRPNMDKIAKGLRAERRGKVASAGGHFGAQELLAEVEVRFRVPAGGGRSTDPNWTERRLVPLTPRTLQRLEELAGDPQLPFHLAQLAEDATLPLAQPLGLGTPAPDLVLEPLEPGPLGVELDLLLAAHRPGQREQGRDEERQGQPPPRPAYHRLM